MELREVVALCFSFFSLGMLTNLGLYLLFFGRPGRRERKETAVFMDCRNCKHAEKGSKDEPCVFCENVKGLPSQWEAQQ